MLFERVVDGSQAEARFKFWLQNPERSPLQLPGNRSSPMELKDTQARYAAAAAFSQRSHEALTELLRVLKRSAEPSVRSSILGREEMFQIILGDLRHNAADAVVERWHPQISSGEVRIRAFLRGGNLWIQILDNGTGIPPEILAQLGKRRGFTTKSEEVGGTLGGRGLGLENAMVHAAIAGWEIVLANRADVQGASASLIIPLKEQTSPSADPAAGMEERNVEGALAELAEAAQGAGGGDRAGGVGGAGRAGRDG